MNEFDNNMHDENANPQNDTTPGTDTAENAEKSNVNNGGIVFDNDGTYHGVAHNYDEAQSTRNESVRPDFSASGTPYSDNAMQGTYQRSAPENGYVDTNANGANNYTNGNGRYSQPYSQPYTSYANTPNPNNGNANRYNNGTAYAYEAAPKKKNGKGMKAFAITASVLCLVLAISLIAVIINKDGPSSVEETSGGEVPGISQGTDELDTKASPDSADNISVDGELTPKGIYNKVLPSSVGILVYTKTKSLASEGSGVLFQESNDGVYTYVITCAHVIDDTSGYIIVQTHDGTEYEAEVVGYDSRTDIGVLRIKASGLTLAEIGDSSKIVVGDAVYAIGNPGGVEFANSFTNGMVSAIDRPVDSSDTGYTMDCIQHTAAINPGNSGGALVNSFGQVIGINSMKIVADEYEGMGFAVPSSVFVKIVNEIMANGYVSNRPKLGITYVAASQYSNYGMFVAIKGLPSGSIVIYEISSDSSLAGTDAQAGDMIVGVNGKDLDDASALSELIENSAVGDELTLSLIRIYDDYSYDEFEITVTLVEDRGTSSTQTEEEETTQQGGYLPDDYDSYEDFFRDYFENYLR